MEGQISLPMCLDPTNYVVQANDLINGKQAMNLNEAKILRLAIMQIIQKDTCFKPYVVKIKELAKLLDIPDSNIYRDIETICNGISEKPIKIKKGKSWKVIPWVKYCEYKEGSGQIYIQLNDELEPYLINLQKYYTQYFLEYILEMKSVYAIRIFELLQKEMKTKYIPKEGKMVYLSVSTIREACECENKYTQFGMFRKKVIDTAIKEIERVTLYMIMIEYVKDGRSVVGFKFYITMQYHKRGTTVKDLREMVEKQKKKK